MNKAKKRAITIIKLIHFYLTWFLDILLSLFIFSYSDIHEPAPDLIHEKAISYKYFLSLCIG